METGSGHETHLCIPLRPVMSMVLRDIPKLMDEPMNGLDNAGVQDIRALLLELKAQGKTILLASHNHEDIAALCDTVHEMDGGVLE